MPVTDPDTDAPDGAVVAGYERVGSTWNVLPKGTEVSLDVTWFGGRTSRISGKLVHIKDGEAYVETSIGFVVGPAESIVVEE